MSAGTKWPDFRLASTLRSLIGSKPEAGLETDSADSSVRKGDNSAAHRVVYKDHFHSKLRDNSGDKMSDLDERSVAGSEGSVGDADGGDVLAGADADFGAIEMFDSNAAPATYSSQVAVADDDAAHRSGKKSKRDKKKDKREKRRKSVDNESPALQKPESPKKHKKSKRRSTNEAEVPDSQQNETEAIERSEDTPWGQLQSEEALITGSQSKKKRKLSDSADGKRHKKRRSHDQESADQEKVSPTFLRKKKGKHGTTESAIYEDIEPESETQHSPTVAHLRRRSQSREARSRENSVSRGRAPQAEMDLGTANDAQAGTQVATDADRDVELLAREAWNEHRNGQHALEEEGNGDQDTAMADQYPQEPLSASLEAIDEADPSSAKSRKSRASRKKAKPTYFEQSPVPEDAYDNKNAFDDLPSPSAITPKARSRTKRAAKKESRGRKPKKEKLSQSMRGGSDEAEDEDVSMGGTAGRRSRLSGYTQGRFTDAELGRIAQAVESFRYENGMSQTEVNDLIHAPGGTAAGETNAQLWVRILAECPDRHRQKVINITRKKFHNFVARGTWTEEQDAELAGLVDIHGPKWAYIGGLVNRHPEDLRDRYRNYTICGLNQRKDTWDEQEEARLTQYVIESMEAIDELRLMEPTKTALQKSYEELIDWQDISERMDRTRSRLQCITKWKSLNIRTHGKDKLASSAPDAQISFKLEKARRQITGMPAEERYRLVMAIYACAVRSDTKIPWQRLVDKNFRNQYHRYSQMLMWRRLKSRIPNVETMNVRDCAHYLTEHYNQHGDLPDIPDEIFDDADEMEYMQSLAPIPSTNGAAAADHDLSTEFVRDSDAEEHDATANGDVGEDNHDEQGQTEPQEEEVKIDPALSEVVTPSKKRTATKRGAGKPPSSRMRSRKSATQDDPIEDPETADLQGTQEQESEVDVEQFRKKKTPGKFKSPRAKRATRQASQADVDSDMEDMEDLPAHVATA